MNLRFLNKDKFIVFLIFSLIFIFLFCLNFLLPPQADDLYAATKAKDGLKSVIETYFTWNARIGEILFVGFIGGMSDLSFDFLNAFMGTIFIFTFFIFIFARIPKIENNINDLTMIVFILFMLLYFAPFGADFLWGAGSLNYMWGILLLIFILLPYRIFWQKEITQQKFKISNKFIPLLVVFSFFGGMASEQLGIVSILVHVVFLIYAFRRKIKIPLWYVFGILSFIIGYCVLYFSPGHAARASMAILNGQFLTIKELFLLSFEDKIHRFLLIIDNSNTNIFNIFLLFLFCIFCVKRIPSQFKILYFAVCGVIFGLLAFNQNILLSHMIIIFILFILKKDRVLQITLYLYLIYLLLCLSGIQILILPPRARLGDIMIIIAIFCILFNSFKSRKIANIAIIFLTISYSIFVFSEYYKFYNNWNSMVKYIEEQKSIGNYDVIVKNIFKSKYDNFIDSILPTDVPQEGPNPLYARKFGLNSFRVDEFY